MQEKKDFEKSIFNLMNDEAFRKVIVNIKKHRDIKLVTTEERRNYLVPAPNYHTTNIFSENVLTIEMKKPKYS